MKKMEKTSKYHGQLNKFLRIKASMHFRLIISSFVLLFSATVSYCQTAKQGDKAVKLISYNAGDCDKTTGTYHFNTRISEISVSDNQLSLTINFIANCCEQFNPVVIFSHDTLSIDPIGVWGDPSKKKASCGCQCCFSIQFFISNISDTNFITILSGERIVHSTDRYFPVFPIKYDVINGDTVNRNNKYGAKVGPWVTYYQDGKVKHIEQYCTHTEELATKNMWTKDYFENGQLAKNDRKDTTEAWYENGNLKLKRYVVYESEAAIIYTTTYFSNGNVMEKRIEPNETGSIYYSWKWDEAGNLVSEPTNWKGPPPN